MTLHCFQVASSCILPSSMCTPRPSGIASITRLAKRTSSGSGEKTRLRDLDLARVQRPRADAAHQERRAELRLAAGHVGDVAERPVEREDAGRRAGVDHAPDRVVPEVLLRAGARRVRVARVRVGEHDVAGVAAADARGLHPPRRREVGRAEAHALHARRGGGDLLDVRDAERGLEDRVDEDRPLEPVPAPRAGRAAGRRSGCPTAPSTLGTMITSSRSPISPTSVSRSSSTHGESSEFTRVHSAVPPRSASRPIRTSPARAASLRSAATASSRLPSRMSVVRARSGSLAAIFSFDGSKKWIIRDGVTGISSSGSGAPGGERLGEVAGVAHAARRPYRRRVARHIAESWQDRGMSPELRRDRPGRPRGERRPPLRPLPRGVRGRRGLQALAGQDRDRGRRPPVLPDHDEPPPAAHQRRLRGAVPAGPQRRRRAATSTRSRSA